MHILRRFPVTVLAVVLIGLVGIQRSDVSAQADLSKLTTVLAELARSVPQEDPQSVPQRLSSVKPLSVETLPKSVRDAMHGRKLRINVDNEVQVYVLLHDVSDESVRQLTASGATIEMTDRTGRRVQARVPVARLQAVAALPFVDFVRLPSYAVRRVGAVTTEGDAILHADVARRELSVDGTGVKIGVISDGLTRVIAVSMG